METEKVISSISNISMVPMDYIKGFKVRPGMYEVNGATALPPHGVNFTVYSYGATSCELLLFKNEEREPYAVLPFPESYKIGKVYSMIVFGLDIQQFEYAYRMDGPYDPSKGLLFNKNNILLDIYAKAVTGQRIWGWANDDFYKARVVQDAFEWSTPKRPCYPMEDLVIYETHIRGFTMGRHSDCNHPGTYAGLMEKIPYLKELGVTAVELMPIFEFDEMRDYREVDGRPLINYWGYNTVSFFAPNTSYASDVEHNREGTELKEMVRALHDNGIEVILDVVFNHTAEGNENGPCFSFKGMDNNIYYMLTPDGKYYNFSGCGNTVNCNHPIVHQMILECLRYWSTAYHIDGFRFDLASILGRNEDGSPMSSPPLLQSLAFDPLLGNVKLIAEAWDAGGLYQVGSFPSWNRWAEWNGRYRDDMRDFLKGDFNMWQVALNRITGSEDIYGHSNRGHNASVNFITCHDGFTLWDLYSYSTKHNEANGWNNTDGADDNRSWNCGEEGETDNPEIIALRKKLARNAMAVLLCSRGVPMFFGGDEFLNSQNGNNNTYCQDNEIAWLNWDDLNKNREHFDFTTFMIKFRMEHRIVRYKILGGSYGLDPICVKGVDEGSKTLVITYTGLDWVTEKEDVVVLAINVFWEPQMAYLNPLPYGVKYKMVADTAGTYIENYYAAREKDKYIPVDNSFIMEPRSVCVLTI